MGMSIKERVIVGFIASTIVLAVGGSVWALVGPKDTATKNEDASSVESSPTDVPKEQDFSNKITDNEANEEGSTASKQSADTTAPPASSPSSQVNPQTTPAQSRKQFTSSNNTPKPPRTQSQKVSCNESMKSSYTSLYNSQISAENARWASQVNGFNNQATGNGGSFSGGAQDKINQYKPAHDTKIATTNNNYRSNLASINCQ